MLFSFLPPSVENVGALRTASTRRGCELDPGLWAFDGNKSARIAAKTACTSDLANCQFNLKVTKTNTT